MLWAAFLSLSVPISVHAQRLGEPVDRPRLKEVVDTNDARAYYDSGVHLFERDPERAAAAFYWAARINPGWGEPLYARRAALLMSQPRQLRIVMESNRRELESPAMRRLDSLQFRALMLNPFLYRQLDRLMFIAYIKARVMERARMSGDRNIDASELDYAVKNYLKSGGESMRGWLAYSEGNFRSAIDHYGNALAEAKDKASIRLDRARIMKMQGQIPSAIAEMKLAIDEMRTKDEKDLVVFYDSKALAEYSIAVMLEGEGDATGAREAYGRSLQEDLAYYPAHMRLGLLALGLNDTATAVSELALASQLAPDEPHVRYVHGFVLGVVGHLAEGIAELRKAIELEPYYALPYLRLGQLYEQSQKGPEALAAYQQYLGRASLNDGQRRDATERIADLKPYLTSVPKP